MQPILSGGLVFAKKMRGRTYEDVVAERRTEDSGTLKTFLDEAEALLPNEPAFRKGLINSDKAECEVGCPEEGDLHDTSCCRGSWHHR